jgi:hypothetical protein
MYTNDFGKSVDRVSRGLLFLAILWTSVYFAFVAVPNPKKLEYVAVLLAFVTILFQIQAIAYSYRGNPKPSYGKALSSLYGAKASSECASLQKQYLNDAALELYSIGSCKRADYLKLLEWINCRDRTTQEFTEFGEKLIELFCQHDSRYEPTN